MANSDTNDEETAYFSEVKFGSNNKPFILVIDTGSSDTWIPSDTCKSRACLAHHTYGSKDSKTLVSTAQTFGIRYGSGQVEGTIVSDSVSFAGFNMNISFGVATRVSDDFVYFPIDGIMGLGPQNASTQNVPTIMDDLVAKRLINEKLFGIALARHTDAVNDGVVNFGAVDAGLFEGELNFMPSLSQNGLWEIKVDDTSVDGRGAGISGRTAVIDSGTSLILVPPGDALKLHSIIPGAQTNGDVFAVPCNTTSNIEFTFGGVKYKVPPKDYVSDMINADEDICQSLITGRVISPPPPLLERKLKIRMVTNKKKCIVTSESLICAQVKKIKNHRIITHEANKLSQQQQVLSKSTWLLGDVFLKNVYSVFDLDNNRVGKIYTPQLPLLPPWFS